MADSQNTVVERELRLIRIPVLPLALSIGMVLAIVYLGLGVMGMAATLRDDAQGNDRQLTTSGIWADFVSIGLIGAFSGFVQGFLPVSLVGLIVNAVLKVIGGVRFVVAEPMEPPRVL